MSHPALYHPGGIIQKLVLLSVHKPCLVLIEWDHKVVQLQAAFRPDDLEENERAKVSLSSPGHHNIQATPGITHNI